PERRILDLVRLATGIRRPQGVLAPASIGLPASHDWRTHDGANRAVAGPAPRATALADLLLVGLECIRGRRSARGPSLRAIVERTKSGDVVRARNVDSAGRRAPVRRLAILDRQVPGIALRAPAWWNRNARHRQGASRCYVSASSW